MNRVLPTGFCHQPVHLVALGLGAGCVPKAPGTFGTVIGVAIYLLAQSLPVSAYVTLTIALFVVGVWVCGKAASALGVHDHPAIVWDEVVGYLITMTAVPQGWAWVVAGFLLFRLLDIAKPWPIRIFDRRMRGGLGIMADDAAAGLMAMAGLHVIAKII